MKQIWTWHFWWIAEMWKPTILNTIFCKAQRNRERTSQTLNFMASRETRYDKIKWQFFFFFYTVGYLSIDELVIGGKKIGFSVFHFAPGHFSLQRIKGSTEFFWVNKKLLFALSALNCRVVLSASRMSSAFARREAWTAFSRRIGRLLRAWRVGSEYFIWYPRFARGK